jgi:hypothetical protein
MSGALRAAVFGVFGALWLSGCIWMVLHFGFPQASPFGPLPNPWEPFILRVHGWLAVAAVFLVGWITAGHVSQRWRRARQRVSGMMLAGCTLLLVLTGYALYYTTAALHDAAAAGHESLGVAAIAIGFAHWWGTRPQSNFGPEAQGGAGAGTFRP